MTGTKTRIDDAIHHVNTAIHCVAETIEREKRLGAMGLLWRGGLWLAAYLFTSWLLSLDGAPVPVRIAVALIPAPFFCWFAWHWMRMVQKMDELERRIQLEALAFAFPLVVVWIMTLGLLTVATPASERLFGVGQLWVIVPLFYYLGLWRAQRHYR